jgi:Photosystem II Pbs27
MNAIRGATIMQKSSIKSNTPPAPTRGVAVIQCVALARSSGSPSVKVATLGRQLAATAAALQLLALPAQAYWDGESSAIGSCPLGDAGTECRTNSLSRDLAKGKLTSYDAAQQNGAKIGAKATNVPVSDLGSQYAKDTASVAESTLKYIKGEVDDDSRPALVKVLKKEGQEWVSKYARGGSARTLSARKFYIAVDQVQGHLAFNGYAPFPKNKVAKVEGDITNALRLIGEGK